MLVKSLKIIMARHLIHSVLVLMIVAAPLPAAQILFHTRSEPTPGLPGFSTWTLSVSSSHPLQGFDFAGDGSIRAPLAKGFFGRMNQLNPFGQPTVFSDNNTIINQVPTRDPNRYKQDSQIIGRTADVVVPPGFAEESGYHLQGISAHSAPVGPMFDIARLVIPNSGSAIVFRGVITTLEGAAIVENQVSGMFPLPLLPLPQVADVTINAAAHSAVMHTFTASDPNTPPEFIGWGNFIFNGPGTAIQPTFDPETQAFYWDTAGSKPGTYTAMVRAWGFFGDDAGSFTIHLVPEPVGMMLALLAMGGVGIVAPRRPRMPASASPIADGRQPTAKS